MSKKRWLEVSEQNKQLFSLIGNDERRTYESGVSCVVFSKDRALQLYALLESFYRLNNADIPILVVFDASSVRHQRSYDELIETRGLKTKRITFIKQADSFQQTLRTVLSTITTTNMFFLTDDNMFVRPIDAAFAATINARESILSFRHGQSLTYCYTADATEPAPSFTHVSADVDLLAFHWFDRRYHWSDPWSVDGHVYATREICALSQISEFNGPNSFEMMLKSYNDCVRDRKGLCYAEPRIVNIPLNLVQQEIANRNGGISADTLLDQWDKNLAIDSRRMEGMAVTSTHEVVAVQFRSRLELPIL
jgi:hypothetical protein